MRHISLDANHINSKKIRTILILLVYTCMYMHIKCIINVSIIINSIIHFKKVFIRGNGGNELERLVFVRLIL